MRRMWNASDQSWIWSDQPEMGAVDLTAVFAIVERLRVMSSLREVFKPIPGGEEMEENKETIDYSQEEMNSKLVAAWEQAKEKKRRERNRH